MRPRGLQRSILLPLAALIPLMSAACGSETPPIRSASPTPLVSGGGGTVGGFLDAPRPAQCASLTDTTQIEKVPLPCVKVWAPYGVHVVPPGDVIARMQVALPPVPDNRTGGAVSDADAQRWALAAQRSAAWFVWLAGHSQLALARRLETQASIPPSFVNLLGTGGTVAMPACAMYPQAFRLVPLGEEGRRFFSAHLQSTAAKFVLVGTYSFPCAVVGKDAKGAAVPLYSVTTAAQATDFLPGTLVTDPVLGDLWYGDAGGSCADSAAPPGWCSP